MLRPGVPDGLTEATDQGFCALHFGSDELVPLAVRQEPGSRPSHVTMTDLGQYAGKIFDGVEAGRPALVTKRGRFIAALVPLDPDGMDDMVLGAKSGRIVLASEGRAEAEPRYTLDEAATVLGLDRLRGIQ